MLAGLDLLAQKIKESFDKNDSDKDGFISAQELEVLMNKKAVMNGLPTFTTEQIQFQMDTYDLDKDGKLNLKEYQTMIEKGFNFFTAKQVID